MEKLKIELLKELVKNGYSEAAGKRVWNISKRKYLYFTDEQAKSFLKLKSHPRYKETVINRELGLLKANIEEIFKGIDKNINLIDMGCGDGTKAVFLLNLLKDYKKRIRYCPVNVNDYLATLAIDNVKKERFSFVGDYKKYIECFESLDDVVSTVRNNDYHSNVVLLLGSILSSFDINDYLFNVSNAMFDGDYLIIGNGIRKGERLANIENYKHPGFNDWFIHLMNSLGFSRDEVEYGVRFNEMRVEGFYKLKVDKVLEYDGKRIEFKAGDEVLVAVLYKFFKEELEKFCNMYFSEVKIYSDKDDECALVLCKK